MSATESSRFDIGTIDNTMLHIVYLLYVLSMFTALPVFIGVIVAYLQRSKALNSLQASHIDWQIRTFWWGLLFVVIGFIVPFILGWVAAIGILILPLIWFVYRIAKGWRLLGQGQPVANPTSLF